MSRLLALHVHVPRLEILENLCFHVDCSDVFAGHFSSWTLSFSTMIESKTGLHRLLCHLTTQCLQLWSPLPIINICGEMWSMSCNDVNGVLTWQPRVFKQAKRVVFSQIMSSISAHELRCSLLIHSVVKQFSNCFFLASNYPQHLPWACFIKELLLF